jgi:hypothetical protein
MSLNQLFNLFHLISYTMFAEAVLDFSVLGRIQDRVLHDAREDAQKQSALSVRLAASLMQ